MIVATYQFGETTVQIADDCIVKTPEERDKVDRDIANAAWACHVASKLKECEAK